MIEERLSVISDEIASEFLEFSEDASEDIQFTKCSIINKYSKIYKDVNLIRRHIHIYWCQYDSSLEQKHIDNHNQNIGFIADNLEMGAKNAGNFIEGVIRANSPTQDGYRFISSSIPNRDIPPMLYVILFALSENIMFSSSSRELGIFSRLGRENFFKCLVFYPGLINLIARWTQNTRSIRQHAEDFFNDKGNIEQIARIAKGHQQGSTIALSLLDSKLVNVTENEEFLILLAFNGHCECFLNLLKQYLSKKLDAFLAVTEFTDRCLEKVIDSKYIDVYFVINNLFKIYNQIEAIESKTAQSLLDYLLRLAERGYRNIEAISLILEQQCIKNAVASVPKDVLERFLTSICSYQKPHYLLAELLSRQEFKPLLDIWVTLDAEKKQLTIATDLMMGEGLLLKKTSSSLPADFNYKKCLLDLMSAPSYWKKKELYYTVNETCSKVAYFASLVAGSFPNDIYDKAFCRAILAKMRETYRQEKNKSYLEQPNNSYLYLSILFLIKQFRDNVDPSELSIVLFDFNFDENISPWIKYTIWLELDLINEILGRANSRLAPKWESDLKQFVEEHDDEIAKPGCWQQLIENASIDHKISPARIDVSFNGLKV